jgi:hypothetical protein
VRRRAPLRCGPCEEKRRWRADGICMNLPKLRREVPGTNIVNLRWGGILRRTLFATPFYSSRQASQPLAIAGGARANAKSREIDDDPQSCSSKLEPPQAISKGPDIVDKRCRSTFASYGVGRRGVTNLVNLKGRTHLISAWDAGTDAMTCRFCRCDRQWQLFPGNHHRQNTHTHLLYMLQWCMPHSSHLAAPDLVTILETHPSCRTDVKSVKASQLRGQGSGYLTPVTRIFNIRHPTSTGQSETTQLAQAIGLVVLRYF